MLEKINLELQFVTVLPGVGPMGSGIRNIHLCEIARKSKLKCESAMNKSEWRKEMTVKSTMKMTAVGITITDS